MVEAAPPKSISVVIPTHNRSESLRRVLESLNEQTLEIPFEVIVVCDGCTDDTASMCRKLSTRYRLVVVDQPQQGPAAARNRALSASAADLIVFIDDDVVPDPGLLREHLLAHEHDDCAVVIGSLLAPPGFSLNPWTRWEAAMLADQYRSMALGRWGATPRQFYTGNASVRRVHLLAVGGFHENFRRAEDVELAYRLERTGLHFCFRPEARGWHYAQRSLKSWLGVARAYGEADVAMEEEGLPANLQSMAREFRWRQRTLRRVARICVGRRVLLDAFVGVALAGARVADVAGRHSAAEAAYSSVFNLCYWNAISDRLGGRSRFWRLIHVGGGLG